MWGGNGKNHTWSMGHYWLVALFVLSATLAHADFMSNDSQNLQQIRYVLLGSGTTDGDSIWALTLQQNAILNSMDSRLAQFSYISSDVVTIKQCLDYNLNGDVATDSMSVHDFIQEFNRKFFKGVDRYDRTVFANPATVSIFSPHGISPFIEPGKTFQKNYTSQIAVTNIAETYWLEKIYDELHGGLNYWSGLSGYTSYQYGNSIFPSEIYNDWADYLRGDLSLQTFLDRWGGWNIYPLIFSNLLDFDNLTESEQERYQNFLTYQLFLDSDVAQALIDYFPYDGLGTIFQHQYGTILLQNMATNTFIFGLDVNNFFTNGVALSLYATNAFKRVAESSGINTNEMYLGSYGSETNSDVFSDIITNGVELLEGNQVYSSLGDDVDAGSLSNKVSMFNFTEKFDDSIKPFLDEIENASGGDWIINFGNIDLGDHFSFTIPSLTVEKNETYLGFVDKFLDLLKIILGVVFFLILWRQLEQAVEST